MTVARELALVVQLACTVEDRTKAEQRALLAVAKRADRAINLQTATNPHLPRPRSWPPPPCTYSNTHDKKCVCRGDHTAWQPVDGWSRLTALATNTWEGQ